MTISSQTRKAGPFTGTGGSSAFPFSFKVFQASDLLVVRLNVSTGVESTLVLTTDYTVSLNADQNANPGGTVTLTSPLASGFKLVISSTLQYLQQTDLANQGGFYPAVITNALDRLTILAQQLKEQVDRAAKLPITSTVDATVLVTNINAVADSLSQIQTVAGIEADVVAVAGVAADIPTVAANVVDITNFADVYQGPKAADPALRNDGGALQAGDLYFNTGSAAMRVYSGTAWGDVAQGTSTPYQTFNGTGAQTAFTLSGTPGSLGSLEVYISGVRQVPTSDYTVSGTTLTFTTAPPAGTANIFVRWISTQAINVPADGSVTLSKLAASVYGTSGANKLLQLDGSGKLPAVDGSQLTGISASGFKNKIINGGMQIVQRGPVALSATANTTYCADRITVQAAGGAGLAGNGANATSGGNTRSGYIAGAMACNWTGATMKVQTRLEDVNVIGLNSKTITVSGKLYHDIGSPRTCQVVVQKANSANNFSGVTTVGTSATFSAASGAYTAFSYTLTLGGSDATNGLLISVEDTATSTVTGKTFAIGDFQLEEGATATPFEVRPVGIELALCQRYFWKLTAGSAYDMFAAGSSSSNVNGLVPIKLPVTMRSQPTFAYSGSFRYYVGGGYAISAMTINVVDLDVVTLYTTHAAIGGAGTCGLLGANNDSSAYMTFTAEL